MKNPSANPYGKSMVSQKTSGFPQNHTRYQGSDLIFEFLDVGNSSVNPYGNFMVSLKIDVFLTSAPPPLSSPLTLVTQQSSDSKSPQRKTSRNVFFEKSVNDVFLTRRTDKQANKQFMFTGLFSTRKRTKHIEKKIVT